MKVYGLNNNYNTYKSVKQNNNKPNFTALKKIYHKNLFNPKEYHEHAELLQTFQESKPLKRFFEEYNGFVSFDVHNKQYYYGIQTSDSAAELNIYYNPFQAKKGSNDIELPKTDIDIERTVALSNNIWHFKISSRDGWTANDNVKFLKDKITKLTDNDIKEKEMENIDDFLEWEKYIKKARRRT